MGKFTHTPLGDEVHEFQLCHTYYEHIDLKKNARFFAELLTVAKDGIIINKNNHSLGIGMSYDFIDSLYTCTEPSKTPPSIAKLRKLHEIIKCKDNFIRDFKKRHNNVEEYEKYTSEIIKWREKDVINLIIGIGMHQYACVEDLAAVKPYSIDIALENAKKSLIETSARNQMDINRIHANKPINKILSFIKNKFFDKEK